MSLTVKATGRTMRWLQTEYCVTLGSSRDPQTVLIIVAVETGQAQHLSSFLGVGLLLH